MPLAELEQEALLDCTHSDYQHLFNTLVATGQSREQATLLLANIWCKRVYNNALQQLAAPQLGSRSQ